MKAGLLTAAILVCSISSVGDSGLVSAAVGLSPGHSTLPFALETENVWREGAPTDVAVVVRDPAVVSVGIVVTGEQIRLGGRSRGTLLRVLQKPSEPEVLNLDTGERRVEQSLSVPYMDTLTASVVARGFNIRGEMIYKQAAAISFVPMVVPEKFETGVVVSKRLQRLYAVQNGSLTAAYLVSTGRTHSDGGGPTPAMITVIRNKSTCAYSKKYDVKMRYWNCLTPDGRYGIHATSPNLYRNLGRPDSHGCIRLHTADAQRFYELFPVGTPVRVVN